MSSLPSLRTVFLGTGSAGNCTAVEHDGSLMLVDCGFSAREIVTRLRSAGLTPERVSAVFVTHEHGDHVRGIDVFVRRHAPAATVYATAGTLRATRLAGCAYQTQALIPGEPVRVGTIQVVAFRTSHDAAEPVGYRIEAGGRVLGLATDTGELTREAFEALTDVDILALECNHDVHMLEHGPYPQHLKRRILSTRGHLSNEDAARALGRLASDRLTHVIAMHRSRTNNTSELAARAFRQELARLEIAVPMHVAEQDSPYDVGSF